MKREPAIYLDSRRGLYQVCAREKNNVANVLSQRITCKHCRLFLQRVELVRVNPGADAILRLDIHCYRCGGDSVYDLFLKGKQEKVVDKVH